jgi:anti-sigma factor RsiW
VSSCPGRIDEISALLDGELDREEELELRRHLESCEVCTAWRAQLAEYSSGLARTIGRERAPRGLGERIDRLAPRSRWPLRAAMALAAAIAVALFWVSLARRAPDAFDSALVADHRRFLAGEESLQVESDDPAVVALDLSQRLPFRVQVSRVEGARLLGGHACRIEDRRAAYLLYDDERAGQRVSVFVFASASRPPPAPSGCRSFGGESLCSWDEPDQSITAVAATADAAQHFKASARVSMPLR